MSRDMLLLASNIEHGIMLFERVPGAIASGKLPRLATLLESGSVLLGERWPAMSKLLVEESQAVKGATTLSTTLEQRITNHAAESLAQLTSLRDSGRFIAHTPWGQPRAAGEPATAAAAGSTRAATGSFFDDNANQEWWQRASSGFQRHMQDEAVRASTVSGDAAARPFAGRPSERLAAARERLTQQRNGWR